MKTYDTGETATLTGALIIWETAPNYNFVIVEVKGKNVGKREDWLEHIWADEQDFEIKVDKGYFYKPLAGRVSLNLSLKPEETGSKELIFEILETTVPIKIHALVEGQRFTVNLQ